MVEAGSIILPCNRRRQLDKLRATELRPQFFKQRLGNLDRCVRHVIGVGENQPFRFGEQFACLVILEGADLLRWDSDTSADRRAYVNSKWTAHQRCDSNFGKVLEPGVNQ